MGKITYTGDLTHTHLCAVEPRTHTLARHARSHSLFARFVTRAVDHRIVPQNTETLHM